ncbi:hypothetical protein PHYSODRAFT_485860 [Phytophthora sojae]|uniref:Uncharacterized protein n=1 Tax=Phytophthora sojae (strain P6497) TaxID=1094619 RepID=G4YWJ4_PHYSP|nr:hypothetical protein PHYSODRAFT_485860 [Phytophthora sojae]EGZ26108.1 hypothetical protein PHYSODRAFT_485860 [Phytophthora sojae]|eukprot:XP_009521396.1 hypothetical protein PHYSODRAFT_485860 [Phytophthora sojae]
MGNAVGVVLPPERIETLRRATHAAFEHGRVAAVVAHVGLVRVIRVAERWYAVVDQRVISRVHRVVEQQVIHRINLLADHIEVLSKLWFVKSISTTSIAEAFDIDTKDVRNVQVSKRDYEVYNCGPELLDVPSWNKVAHVLELQNPEVTDFLLNKCRWTVWQPPTSWRVKVDQIFNVTVHIAVRQQGFLTGEIRVVRLRLGRKWVGAHHLSEDMAHPMKSQWLHRVDYEVGDQVHTAESEFFQTVKAAWEDYLAELAKLPKEEKEDDNTGEPFPYDEQEKRTSLRIKYLLDTSLENILNDRRTMFRMPHQYELWRMEQEDAPEHRQDCLEDRMVGPLLHGPIDELIELYEEKGAWLPRPTMCSGHSE